MIFLCLVALLNFSISARASDVAVACAATDSSCVGVVEIKGGKKLEYYRNYDLSVQNDQLTKLVIIVHGVSRHFGNAFQRMNTVYADRGETGATLVVAPHFLADADRAPEGMLYWGVHDWASGNDSKEGSEVSSYEAMDTLLRNILSSENFPNLSEVLITGLSAGGQFTQRFAAGSEVEEEFPSIHFRYIISSPSSYLYFDTKRWVTGSHDEFDVPPTSSCRFNSYRYGLDDRNRYMNRISGDRLIANFRDRDVVVMVGEKDDATSNTETSGADASKDSTDLDVSCSAEFQGASRVERARVYAAYLDFLFPEKVHPLVIGPGVAHQLKLYSLPEAQPWL